jgi:ribosome-binding factor A
MPKDFSRPRRVAEQIQRELADLVRLELKDPRVGMVTLTGVDVTSDYAHAKVYVTLLGGTEQVDTAHRMKLRITPQLHFVYDNTVADGAHLSQLIDAALAGKAPE